MNPETAAHRSHECVRCDMSWLGSIKNSICHPESGQSCTQWALQRQSLPHHGNSYHWTGNRRQVHIWALGSHWPPSATPVLHRSTCRGCLLSKTIAMINRLLVYKTWTNICIALTLNIPAACLQYLQINSTMFVPNLQKIDENLAVTPKDT